MLSGSETAPSNALPSFKTNSFLFTSMDRKSRFTSFIMLSRVEQSLLSSILSGDVIYMRSSPISALTTNCKNLRLGIFGCFIRWSPLLGKFVHAIAAKIQIDRSFLSNLHFNFLSCLCKTSNSFTYLFISPFGYYYILTHLVLTLWVNEQIHLIEGSQIYDQVNSYQYSLLSYRLTDL